ncbi:MAG: ribonuclease III [Bacteroidetes bacterium]|nr:ribonuclease III [Bacteroidota bacterium]
MANPLKSLFAPFSPHRKQYRKFKNLLGFYPGNLNLYEKAFRHRSVVTNDYLPSNERLEFLGDAILGAVVSHFLFQRFPFKDEGFLTKLRSRIVSRENLNSLALKLGLQNLVEKVQDRRMSSKSVYGDAFEALIGAIYIDKGYDFTKDFILNRIVKFHLDIEEFEQKDLDFKSKLINHCQKEKKLFQFKTLEEGPAHDKVFKVVVVVDQVVLGKGADNSKKRAEQKAAEVACAALNI